MTTTFRRDACAKRSLTMRARTFNATSRRGHQLEEHASWRPAFVLTGYLPGGLPPGPCPLFPQALSDCMSVALRD